MSKISFQSKGITSNSCEKNPQTMLVVIWTEKAPQTTNVVELLILSSSYLLGFHMIFVVMEMMTLTDSIFISQDKYVAETLRKFRFTKVKNASTPMETQKPLLKDEDGEEVDVHMYRLMIGSLMYLTSSRPDIMFTACSCARYQVNPKVSYLYAVKRIFRYLKGQPRLGLL
nr:putative ribonuclease H-like domain-containing protein [Tanacetum cinerariifolium]